MPQEPLNFWGLSTSRYKLTLSYDGTEYSGWQVQPNGQAIQPLVQRAIETVLRHPIRLSASGRTDAGVHALAQIAHFDSPTQILPLRFILSANALLPPDIRILACEPVPPSFHSRYHATGKIYHYSLQLGHTLDPFHRRTRTHLIASLDIPLIRSAAPLFIGTHDFTSFSNQPNKGAASRDPIRTLTRLDIFHAPPLLRFEFEGDGFLYKMVRNITGTLLEIGRHKRPLADIPLLFAARDRRRVGPAAPPQGLCLIQVRY